MNHEKVYMIHTLGCKANVYDSQQVENHLQKEGWKPYASSDQADHVELCIVNSCAVTDQATKDSIRETKKIKKKFPHAKVVFTGCAAEVEPDRFESIDSVDYVLGNQSKFQFSKLWEKKTDQKILGSVKSYDAFQSEHPMDREWPKPEDTFFAPFSHRLEGSGKRTRSFLKIQEGCNSFCTFCIIPYGRGPSRSLSEEKVVEQIQSLVKDGTKEVILTGTNIGQYQEPEYRNSLYLVSLVKSILKNTKLERLRISSLDPVEITKELVELVKNEQRICPHFHVSLQHVDSKILRLMKRHYRQEEVLESFHRMNEISQSRGSVYLGMDYIVGFPGESEEIFQSSLKTLEEMQWDRIHVFPYSERSGTPATRMKNKLDFSVRKERAKVLQTLSFQRLRERSSEKLKSFKNGNRASFQDVLLENQVMGPDGTKNWISGYSKDYSHVLCRMDDQEFGRNKIVSVNPSTLWSSRSSQEVYFICEKTP